MCIASYYNLAHKFYIIICILLLKLSHLQQNKRYASGTDTNSFRFQGFEPRVFHFHYTNVTYKPKISIFDRRNFDEHNHKNETRKSYRNTKYTNLDRESRGFHFYSTDDYTQVEVEFIIPFMRIPIEGGMQLTRSAVRNLMNLRTGSLLWAGALISVGTLFAGAFNSIRALLPLFSSFKHNKRLRNIHTPDLNILDNYMRSSTSSEENSYDIGTILNEKLMEYNIDLNACMQKMICRFVQKTSEDVRTGKASSTQKILDGFASTQLLLRHFSGTAVQIAIEAGQNSNCHKWKKRCKLPQLEKSDFVNSIFKYFSGE